MKHPVIASLVAALGISCGAYAAGTPAGPEAKQVETRKECYVPGMGEIMGATQMRHSKLWFAGRASNWDLAGYELDEIREGLDDAVKYHPVFKKDAPVAVMLDKFMARPLSDIGSAVQAMRLLSEGARLDEDAELLATGAWTESSAPAVLACLRAQLDPRPPLALARSIAERGLARAGMDLSDGLSLDLVEICSRSGVGAVIEASAVPVDPRAAGLERARGGDPLSLALHGGEDYQLLLAVGAEEVGEISDLARVWGVEVAAVGEFVEGEPIVRLRDVAGERPLVAGGHDHFRSGPA